jgi:hypothetical protein
MATVTYTGSRSYVEYKSTVNGITYGWTRQRTVENIPEDLAQKFRTDTSNLWIVSDEKPVAQAKEMAKVIEEPVVEEEPVEDSDEVAFDPNWTRGEMIKWFSARGETTPRTATKASLTARAEALLNPAAEEESSEGDE